MAQTVSSKAKLGIIAGGGQLPLMLADACRTSGRPFFVIGIEGFAQQGDIDDFPHGWTWLGTIGKTIKLLKSEQCTEAVLAGIVKRPDFANLKLDAKGVMLLPRVVSGARHGDDGLLRVLIEILEEADISVVGADDVLAELVIPRGALGVVTPNDDDRADIERARQVIAELGRFDIGQGAVVCRELVLAVEAAEGTDAMLLRCADLPKELRGTPDNPRGVLVKMPKPIQEHRVDLPTIGVQTIERAAAADLKGVAVAAGRALILDREATIQKADSLGLFIWGMGETQDKS